MLTIPIGIDPVAFSLGSLHIHWYGLMYVVAIFTGVIVTGRLAPRLGVTEDNVWDFVPFGVAAGMAGGRLYYVVQNHPEYYLAHPEAIPAVWQGGMAFFGAIMAVALAAVLFARWRGMSMWAALDAGSMFAAIGQPIGRLGNIVNGDVIGYTTDVPWGTAYTHPGAFVPELGVPYHPAAAYSILVGLVLIASLLWILRMQRRGLVFATYLIGYSVTQFIVFFWRANSITLWGLKQGQLSAIGMALVGLGVLYALNRRRVSVTDTRERRA